VLAVVVAAWGLTVLLSTWLAARLGPGRHRTHGIIVGLALLALVGINMSMLPYPIWFCIANLVAFPFAIYCGTKFAGATPSGTNARSR
jgi:hypothetical protein